MITFREDLGSGIYLGRLDFSSLSLGVEDLDSGIGDLDSGIPLGLLVLSKGVGSYSNWNSEVCI